MKQDNEHRPAYLRLYERLRGEIVRGDYPFGARMPSKRQLAEEEGLSVVTVEARKGISKRAAAAGTMCSSTIRTALCRARR